MGAVSRIHGLQAGRVGERVPPARRIAGDAGGDIGGRHAAPGQRRSTPRILAVPISSGTATYGDGRGAGRRAANCPRHACPNGPGRLYCRRLASSPALTTMTATGGMAAATTDITTAAVVE